MSFPKWALAGILVLAAAGPAWQVQAQGNDEDAYGYDSDDWDDAGDWGDDWDDFEFDWDFFDDAEDPSDYASDVDADFEADDVLALNLSAASLAVAQRLGFRVREVQRLSALKLRLVRLRPPSGMNVRKALAELRKADRGGYYDLNPIYRLAEGTAAPRTAAEGEVCAGTRCYAQEMIGWNRIGCAVPARIGMVDSALDAKNPALAGRKIRYRRLHRSRPGAEELDHGTAVAALLVGAPASGFPGLLPQAELIAADVFSRGRDGHPYTDAARLAAGLDWIALHKPSVVNLSITGPDGGVLHTAVRRLFRSGVAVVAAAGNHGPQAAPEFPAAYPEVIAITAVDRRSQVYAAATRGVHVALSAPGVAIWTAGAGGTGAFRDGTSFAAPFATAAIAALRAQAPSSSPETLLGALKARARDLGTPGNDPVFGWGLLQAQACPI